MVGFPQLLIHQIAALDHQEKGTSVPFRGVYELKDELQCEAYRMTCLVSDPCRHQLTTLLEICRRTVTYPRHRNRS